MAAILGAACGNVVNSLALILTPPIVSLLGEIHFSSLFFNLSYTVRSATLATLPGVPVIAYGLYLNAAPDLRIGAFPLFLPICRLNRFQPPPRWSPIIDRWHCYSTIPSEASRCLG